MNNESIVEFLTWRNLLSIFTLKMFEVYQFCHSYQIVLTDYSEMSKF